MGEALTSSKRLAKNTIMMYIRMGITMLANLIITRLVLQSLGAEDFGLYNAVSGIVVLITFLNNAMMLATQRYMSYALGERSISKLQDIFNASLYIYLGIVIIIFILGETVGLWFLNNKMVFPSEKLGLANFVYHFSLIITCFNILRTPFNSLFVANEKMNFYALLAILEAGIHLLFVFILVYFSSNPSYMYIVLQTISVIIIMCWIILYFKKEFSQNIVLFVKITDKKLFNELLSFSGWGIFGSIAVVGFQQGINILLNIFFGVTSNAAFGIANRVNSLVNHFFTGFQTAANPQITKSYASGDVYNQLILVTRTTKISFFLLLFVGTIVIYNLEAILNLWLGTVPDHTLILSKLMIIGAMIDALSSPLYVMIYATGRIKYYQITISLVLLLNVVLSYVFFKNGFSIEYCLYIRIILFIVAYILRLLFVKAYTSLNIYALLKNAILPIMIISSVVVIILSCSWAVRDSLSRAFIVTPIHILIMLLLILYIGFTKQERTVVKDMILKRIRK